MIDFNGSTLFISARSPFARRVRLAFLENSIKFDEKVLNVFESNPELTVINPLSRVPALLLADGSAVIESNAILALFYTNQKTTTGWPESEKDRLTYFQWSALAVGLCEKLVEYYLETLRPKESQDPVVFAEMKSCFEEVAGRFDKFINNREYIVGHLTQADFDMVAALDYLCLRYRNDWEDQFPRVHSYLTRLRQRPAFAKTRPPA